MCCWPWINMHSIHCLDMVNIYANLFQNPWSGTKYCTLTSKCDLNLHLTCSLHVGKIWWTFGQVIFKILQLEIWGRHNLLCILPLISKCDLNREPMWLNHRNVALGTQSRYCEHQGPFITKSIQQFYEIWSGHNILDTWPITCKFDLERQTDQLTCCHYHFIYPLSNLARG